VQFGNDTLMKNLREEEWARTVEVNCKGALNCVGAVLPGMLGRGRGHIVTISSDAGRKVFPGLAVYSGSKFFVEAVSQGLRLETAGTGLRVTTIQPGNVATDLPALSHDTEALERYGQPSGARILDPDDIAESIIHVLRQPDHVAVNEILVEPRDEPV
jgi:NADP-dependent 3-hydroxy acid dehydrogenase YdfG